MRMRTIWAVACCALTLGAMAAEFPYDEKADAQVEVRHALEMARSDHKNVLVVFGANWCPDCRELDKALHGSSQALIAARFDVVKVDVGNFNKNLDIAQRYGNPIKSGIPAVVVLTADEHVLYSTRGGELANARRMGENGIYEFLSTKVANLH